MKKVYFFAAALFAVSAHAQTVDFEDLTLPGAQTFWNGSDQSGNFTTSGPQIEFENAYDTAWGGYWSAGFAYTNQVSDTMTGTNGQYSSFADGGMGGTGNYVIGKGGSEMEIITGITPQDLSHVNITNTNYAASSMLNGDQFAKVFGGSTGDDQDWFLLTIKGYNGASLVDSTEFYLADYRFSDNSLDYIVDQWTEVQLGWANVTNVTFGLTSSDNSGGYMNTPSFFAMDDIVMENTVGIQEENVVLSLYPNPTNDVINISLDGAANGNYVITNMQGQIVENNMLTNETTALNVSNLSTGIYQITVQTNLGLVTRKFQKI
ncbi:MAG: hypothetical protein ACI8Q1_000878 [Parvicella sp.]|jgi:hypothetical protein